MANKVDSGGWETIPNPNAPAAAQASDGWQTIQTPQPGPGAASRFGASLYDSTIGGIVDTLKHIAFDPSERVKKAAANGDWHEVVKEGLLTALPGVSMAKDIVGGSMQSGKQAIDEAKAGNYGNAAIAGAGAVPFLGPMLAKPAQQFAQGDIAGGLGSVAGNALMLAGPEVVKAALPAKLALAPRLAAGMDPAESLAVQLGKDEDIRMTPATRTNNQVVRNAQKLAGSVPFAAASTKAAVAAEQADLAATGAKFAEQAHPAPTMPSTPELTGSNLRGALESRKASQASSASAAYNKLEQIENLPANRQTVTVGQKPSSVLDANGNPVMTPVTKDIALPVDVSTLKPKLQGISEQIKQQLPVGQQQYSKGLLAIQNILDGPDVVPASVAEKNLSALKAIQREAVNAKTQWAATQALKEYAPAVENAVAQAGPDAINALREGRQLTAAKYATQATMDQLPTEPVSLYNKLTSGKDANINLLRDVESKAPAALPAVGRAYLEGLMQKAFGEAGTARPGAALTEWQKLGESTKRVLFQDPQLRERLDRFFVLAKKAAENPNPSGTASTAMWTSDGAMLVSHPHVAVPYVIGRAALARMMMSQAGASALADGLSISVRNPAAASLAAGRILKLAGGDAAPMAQPQPAP